MLLCGHALADFALQSDAMAKGKNRHNKNPAPKGQKYTPCWPYWLIAHSLIHGGIVYLITGNLFLGIIETVLHSVIDFMKCENVFTPHTDQALHLLCKVMYL